MPVLLLSAGQAGATAPAALAGALAQEVAEVLAGLVYVNAIKPGHPAIFGTWCFVSDLRTGAMSGGSPEQALLSAAAGQMAHFYDLTGGTASGMTDSKVAGRAGRRREGAQSCARRQRGRQLDLRIRRHAREPSRLLAREPDHRQRHHRRDPAHDQRHRRFGGEAILRNDQGRVLERAGTLPRVLHRPCN